MYNMLSRLVITFLPKSKRLFISWLQSPSAVILEPKKIKSVTVWVFIYSRCKSIIRYVICKYFLPLFGLCFYFLDGILWSTTVLIFIRNSFLFLFGCLCFTFEKPLPNLIYKEIFSLFSSKSFVIFVLIFGSLIHFELIFIYDVKKGSSFIFKPSLYSIYTWETESVG